MAATRPAMTAAAANLESIVSVIRMPVEDVMAFLGRSAASADVLVDGNHGSHGGGSGAHCRDDGRGGQDRRRRSSGGGGGRGAGCGATGSGGGGCGCRGRCGGDGCGGRVDGDGGE